MQYVISNVELYGDLDDTSTVSINRLSEYWGISNSWVKAFSHWRKQEDDAMDASGSKSRQAKWSDFKIFMNQYHTAATAASQALLPVNCVTEATAQGVDPSVHTEWDYSHIVVPNDGAVGVTNEYKLQMLGDDDDPALIKGLVHNYALSRARPMSFDPNQPAVSLDGGLYQDMIDVGDDIEEVLSNTRTENFIPPYLLGSSDSGGSPPMEWYPGGANDWVAGLTNQDTLSVRGGSSALNTDNSGPFSALCGLVEFNNLHPTDNLFIKVTLAPGAYHGVMARPMQDVN